MKAADGWGPLYLQLETGARDHNEKLAKRLRECAEWHKGQTDEPKAHARWAKLLENAADKV